MSISETFLDRLRHSGTTVEREPFGYKLRTEAPQDATYLTIALRVGPSRAGNTLMLGGNPETLLSVGVNDAQAAALAEVAFKFCAEKASAAARKRLGQDAYRWLREVEAAISDDTERRAEAMAYDLQSTLEVHAMGSET